MEIIIDKIGRCKYDDMYDSDIDNDEEEINEKYWFYENIHDPDLIVSPWDPKKYYMNNPYPQNPFEPYDDIDTLFNFNNCFMKNAQFEAAYKYDTTYKKEYYYWKTDNCGFGKGLNGYCKWIKYKYVRKYDIDLDYHKFLNKCPIYKKQLKKMIFSRG
jgi:hypothetical protein